MYNKPLAYFITFTTYGTWLHGDPRKSIKIENGHPKLIESNTAFHRYAEKMMKHPATILDKSMRHIVRDAIVDRCQFKQWRLYAAHVRSNHVHILVNSSEKIDKVMISLKTRSTRMLRYQGHDLPEVWTQHGSTKYVFTKVKLLEKIRYIIHEQGEMMAYYIDPAFENKNPERK